MSSKKIIFIAQEITPYLKPTPQGEYSRDLPTSIQSQGYEVRMFMPKYGAINERRNQLHEVIRLSGLNIPIDDTDHPLIIKVATMQPSKMQVYFIDNDDYFHRNANPGVEIFEEPEENDERLIFYVRGVMETVRKLRWEPQVIHGVGWMAALSPLYQKKMYAEDPTLGRAKIVYTIYDHGFEGTLNEQFIPKLKCDGLTDDDIKALGEGPVDAKALNRLAIEYADGVVVGTPDAPEELVEYARQLGKPLLTFAEATDGAAVEAFYNSL